MAQDDTSQAERTVRNAPDRHRFEVLVGDDVAGFTEYIDEGSQRIFFHTEVDDRFAGQGLASVLVTAALNETRSDGKRIVPICPYVASYLKKHNDFADIADEVTPDAMRAVKAFKKASSA
ncbi:GNAT family N-acetyltransferase [Antrihabitans sp. NCIMB 15449]|uniref:GNAT family N-acetyltransferase n=1 Tax=Antrihabitans spumae TaxID=3373370 RepID=A0ABW7JUV4_9NOCA